MMRLKKRNRHFILLLSVSLFLFSLSCEQVDVNKKIGVIFVVHGGMDTYEPQYMWDAVMHQFSYDPNHSVYKYVIWNSEAWPAVLDTNVTEFAKRFTMMFEFGYERLGGTDPGHSIIDKQFEDLKAELDNNTYGFEFEVDWASWMAPQYTDHYPYPRFVYNVPDNIQQSPYISEDAISKCNYCGENDVGGPWEGCDPNRFDVDGPAERLLKKGVSRIIMVDLTTSGVRFSKTFDVVQMTKKVLNKWNARHRTSIPLLWVNDPENLMERSYPTEPEGWTRVNKVPDEDPKVPLEGNPNPVAEDPELALLHVEGIEASFSDSVPDNKTGVLLFNHALHDYNEYFDPKIDDTLILNENIKSLLLERHPDMDPTNIIGAYGGIKEENPENGLVERTREMRGETYGYAWLYESEKQMPDIESGWGYRYWDALEYLKDRGVKHIVIGFPQVIIDNNLNLIEVPNQIGKEIGIKTWANWETGDFSLYPDVGHPFADYWGVWVNDCEGKACCFEMGGCADGGEYPPPRQTPIDEAREDLDPSLAFDLSDYGNLGYDPDLGPPDSSGPVQDQYTGTWDMYRPANDDPRVGKLLAKHVLNVALGKLK